MCMSPEAWTGIGWITLIVCVTVYNMFKVYIEKDKPKEKDYSD